jgi:hypothetical protein
MNFLKQNIRKIASRHGINYLKDIHQRSSWNTRIRINDTLIHYIHVIKLKHFF